MMAKAFVIMLLPFYVATTETVDEMLDDAKLNFTSIVIKYGLPCEEYDVTTEDGYILKMFHIPGNKTKPILLMHGMIDSADTLVLRGRNALGYLLAEAGYDVWFSNYRGNRYSRRHVTLNPDTDKEFWDFSIHEHGYYDLAASIDFVLNQTKMSQLGLVAYSEGSTLMFVLGSTRPEYNDKINIFIAITPICNLQNLAKIIPTFKLLAETARIIIKSFNVEEFMNHDSALAVFARNFCGRNVQYCINALSVFGEIEHNSFEPKYMRVLTAHYPAGVSRKNLEHYYQILMSGRFAQYDYGPEKNLVKYKSRKPPLYNLKKVSAKVAIIGAEFDRISSDDNLRLLKKNLPNIVYYKIFEKFSHFDLLMGRYSPKRVFPSIFILLKTYGLANEGLMKN